MERCGCGDIMVRAKLVMGQPHQNPPLFNGPEHGWTLKAMGFSTYALKSDGTAWVCGSNTSGQLGDGSTISKSSPVQVPGLTWQVILGGYVTPCILK